MSNTIFETLYGKMAEEGYAEHRVNDLVSLQMSRADGDTFGSVCVTTKQAIFGSEYEVCLYDFKNWEDKYSVFEAYVKAVTTTRDRFLDSAEQLSGILKEIVAS